MSPMPQLRGHEEPKQWFTITATKTLYADDIQFDMECTVNVYAANKSDAMKKVRQELNNFYLE